MSSETFGAALKRWRTAMELSSAELAKKCSYSKSYISLLENGRREPNVDLATILDQALEANGELIRLAAEAESAMRRRTFLSSGIVALAAPVVGLDDLSHLVAALDNARRYMDGSVVDHFRRQIAACAADDGARGPKRTLPSVLGVIGAIESRAREVKPDVRRELLSVGAQGAEFAGWLYRDIGSPVVSSYWHDRAIEWAQEAGDHAMQGYVLLKKSQSAWDERNALRMLTLAQAVQDGPWQLPIRVRAEAAQQEARGHAMLHGEVADVERKLDEAQVLLAQAQGANEESTLGVHYDASLLTIQTAICYCEAGRADRAVEIYQQWLSQESFSRRDYGYFLSLMGGTLAAAGEPDEAARVGLTALNVAQETNSSRTIQELVRLIAELNPWSAKPSVRELREAVVTANAG